MEITRAASMSEGIVEAYGRGRARRWRWAARVRADGKSVQYRRRGFNTRDDALADRDRMLAELRNPGSTKPTEVLTFSAALDRLLAEKSRTKSIAEYRRVAARLMRAFGKDTTLADLTASRISAWRAERLAATSSRTGKPLSIASINRPLAVLRHLLKVAATDWGVLEAAPHVRLEKEGQGRLRWLTKEEATRLIDGCRQSRNPDLLALVTVALGTGLRQGELLALTWADVDRQRGVIRLEVTKSGRRREVPFGTNVERVLAARDHTTGKVFRNSGWDTYRSAFERAVAVASIENFHFHDLRHTYASWLVQHGAKLQEIKDLLGHATLTMVLRYAHLAPQQHRSAVARLDGILSDVVREHRGADQPASRRPDARRVAVA